MDKVLNFLADQTGGRSYKSYKYCVETPAIPTLAYEDGIKISFNKEKIGETQKNIKGSKSLEKLAKQILHDEKPLFKYFLDGSRRIYKIDDMAYSQRLYPIIAGQVGVACCERQDIDSFKITLIEKKMLLSLPRIASKDGDEEVLYFSSLLRKINALNFLQRHGINFNKVLHYDDKQLKEGEKYEHKAIAKIQNEMIETEKKMVKELVQSKKINLDSYLLKDGSLEYGETSTDREQRLSVMRRNYQCVVGVSKSFNPELLKDKSNRSIAQNIADLPAFHRTPAYRYETDAVKSVKFSVWYLRLREQYHRTSPFDGVVKVEKILVSDQEQEFGLDSEEIDRISANLINERNPTCYGSDLRWANHLYPVFLTETFIKSQYLSDMFFLNLF